MVGVSLAQVAGNCDNMPDWFHGLLLKDLIDKSFLIFNQMLPVLLGKITTAFNDFSTGIIIIIAFILITLLYFY